MEASSERRHGDRASNDGELEAVGDKWRLRFTRKLRHPPEKVWRALTEPEHLGAWFPTDVIGERKAGAPIRFHFRNGEAADFDGEMTVFEPPSVLEFWWGPDLLRFELTPDDEGGCVLVLLDTVEAVGKAARDAAGWHECLGRLADDLDGAEQPTGEQWRDVHPRYVEQFGPEAATIGPPTAS